MKNRGAIVVLFLLAAGLAAAVGAIWHQYRQTRQALRFWGSDAARLIDRAPAVGLWPLDPRGQSDLPDEVGPRDPAIDLSGARGLIHFRRSLLEDANFAWYSQSSGAARTDWDYAVRFTEGDEEVVVLFDTDQGWIARRGGATSAVQISEQMAEGFRRFFEEHLPVAVE